MATLIERALSPRGVISRIYARNNARRVTRLGVQRPHAARLQGGTCGQSPQFFFENYFRLRKIFINKIKKKNKIRGGVALADAESIVQRRPPRVVIVRFQRSIRYYRHQL